MQTNGVLLRHSLSWESKDLSVKRFPSWNRKRQCNQSTTFTLLVVFLSKFERNETKLYQTILSSKLVLYRVQIDKRAYNLYMATRELCACIHIIASGFSPHSKELLILCWAEERQTVLLCRESIGLLPSQKKLYPDLYIVRSPWSWPWEKKHSSAAC